MRPPSRLCPALVAAVALVASLLAGGALPAGAAPLAARQPADGELVIPSAKEPTARSATLDALAAALPEPVGDLGDPQVQSAADAALLEEAAALRQPVEGAGSLLVAEGRVLVTIHLANLEPGVVEAVEAAGAVVVDVNETFAVVTARVAPSQLDAVSGVAGVQWVNEVRRPRTGTEDATQAEPDHGGGEGFDPGAPPVANAVNCSTNPTGIRSEGYTQLGVDAATVWQAVDGTGVTVGIISDSFDARSGAQADVVAAELPGPGNPCGHPSPVRVLDGFEGGVESDEGRAMAQIVHDLAPGAELTFATGFEGEYAMASAIEQLALDGADVIVDDIGYLGEPLFQDGPIAAAIDSVTAGGVTYFSAAGNDHVVVGGREVGSYEAPAFRAMGCPGAFPAGYTCHDFNPGAGQDSGNTSVIAPGSFYVTMLGWDDAMGESRTDLDAALLGPSGNVLALSIDSNAQSGRPVELVIYQNTSGSYLPVTLSIGRYAPATTGSGTPRLKTIVFALEASSVEWNTSSGGDVVGPTLFGHGATIRAGSIAAIPYHDPNQIEPFSSRGPARSCWDPVGSSPTSRFPQCLTTNLDVAATDGVRNSFFGPVVEGAHRFFGTSAAAPHAAAVAALQRQKQPCRSPEQFLAAQRASAVPVGGYGVAAAGSGRLQATRAITSLPPCDAPTVGAGFRSLEPTRILDSRGPNGGWAGPLPAGAPRDLQVTGRGGDSNIPASATAVVMNVTVTNATTGSFLTVWPSGQGQPTTSNLNFGPNQTIPNLVTVKLGVGGKVRIANAVGSVNVIADVVGYFDDGSEGGERFNPLGPKRLLDSRGATGGWGAPLVAGAPRSLTVVEPGNTYGVPATATAVIANITVVNPTSESFVSVWPAGSPQPGVSNLNFGAGQIIPNLAMVKIGKEGKIAFANAVGSVDVVVDVVGYYDPTRGARFFATTPTRILDSRHQQGAGRPWGTTYPTAVPVVGPASGVPEDATGLVANVTATDTTAQTVVTVYPTDIGRPNASNLNVVAGQTIPNLVVVPMAPSSGRTNIVNDKGSVNLIADVVGYFAP